MQSGEGDISTVAGSVSKRSGGDDGPATNAGINSPEDLTIDKAGNLFIADTGNDRIRRVDARTGIITTVAGSTGGFSGDGGPATRAGLNSPGGIAVDDAGNLFIADTGNSRVRRVDAATGVITTIAGNGTFTFSGDGGRAVNAGLNSPEDVAVDSAGNLFIADTFNDRIRRVDTSGNITTVAGSGKPSPLGDDGPAIAASLVLPDGVVVDKAGNLFIVDTENNRIRRVDTGGMITTVVGSGSIGFGGDGGRAVNASINFPEGMAVDGAGNLFIVDTENNRIRRVDAATGNITTVVGNGLPGFRGDGGKAVEASVNFPEEVVVDANGNLFIADTENNVIRLVKGSSGGGQMGDFTLSANPASQIVTAGASTSFTIGIQGTGGFTQPVSLSAALNPSNNDIRLSFSSLMVTPGGNATLTVATGAGLPTSAFNITITGTSGQIVRNQTVMLNITGVQNPAPTISTANFKKPTLTINGTGFGSSAKVSINGQDTSSRINGQSDTLITLKGGKKKLNLKKGQNQITVTANGVTSNTFVLNLLF